MLRSFYEVDIKISKKYKLLFLIDAISVFGFALVELGIPTLISRMIDQGVNTKDTSFYGQIGR